MPLLNYNDVICANDELLYVAGNRAFRFGEGLIETMLWQKKAIRLYERHVQRLAQSLSALRFPSFTGTQLQKAIAKVILANQEPETGMVRAQFFRHNDEAQLDYMIEVLPLASSPGNWPEQGLTVGTCRTILKNADSIASLKTTSRLPYVIAAQEALDKGWDDVLLCNSSGRIAESTICNVFMIRDNKLYTPPLSEGCIAGIMRGYLLEQGIVAGLEVKEAPLDENDLGTAEEIFLTNAIKGIQPVTVYNGKSYDCSRSRKIFDLISNL